MTRLGALVGRPPVFVAAGRDGARRGRGDDRRAHQRRARATGDGVGIVTDRDLRERVLADGRSADEPVRRRRAARCRRAPAERTASEALVDLLDPERARAVRDRPRRADRRRADVEDIAGGEHSPFALRRAIARAADEDALVRRCEAGLPRLLASLLSAGLAPADSAASLTVQTDTATLRLVDFAFRRHGPAPVAWAWLGARQRRTARADARLRPGQRARLRRRGGPGRRRALRARGGRRQRRRWPAAAWARTRPRCSRATRAGGCRRARGSAVFEECLEQPGPLAPRPRGRLASTSATSAAACDIVPPLAAVVRDARAIPVFLARLARTATDWKVAARPARPVATDRDGRIDLKTGGALPIANLARFHALSDGITISGTLDRLVAAEEPAGWTARPRSSLREAFETVSRDPARAPRRRACADGRPADNRVDPGRSRRCGARGCARRCGRWPRPARLAVYAGRGRTGRRGARTGPMCELST